LHGLITEGVARRVQNATYIWQAGAARAAAALQIARAMTADKGLTQCHGQIKATLTREF
jgi:hypothetical protein